MLTERQRQKKESQERYHHAKMEAFTEIKKVCVVCDEKMPVYCLDFHHVNDYKDDTVGRMKLYNVPKLVAELCRCVVVCSNCHRKIHHGDEPCPTTTLSKEFVEPILVRAKATAQGRKTFEFRGLTCASVGV